MKRNINYSFDGKEKDKKAENNIIAALKSKYGDRFFESDLLNKTTKETRTGWALRTIAKDVYNDQSLQNEHYFAYIKFAMKDGISYAVSACRSSIRRYSNGRLYTSDVCVRPIDDSYWDKKDIKHQKPKKFAIPHLKDIIGSVVNFMRQNNMEWDMEYYIIIKCKDKNEAIETEKEIQSEHGLFD